MSVDHELFDSLEVRLVSLSDTIVFRPTRGQSGITIARCRKPLLCDEQDGSSSDDGPVDFETTRAVDQHDDSEE